MRDQVIETQCESTNGDTNFHLFKENGIEIIYSFWVENGLMSFIIYNNSDKPIYVDWYKSAFIYNGARLTYWEDKETRVTKGQSANLSLNDAPVKTLYSPFKSASLGVGVFEGVTVVSKEERITFIPPKSRFVKNTYRLAYKPFNMKGAIVEDVNRNDKPNKTTQVKTKIYRRDESPLLFRNYLTWSFTEDFKNEYHIDNEFWIKQIKSMSKKHFKGKVASVTDGKYIYDMPYASPKNFYVEFDQNK